MAGLPQQLVMWLACMSLQAHILLDMDMTAVMDILPMQPVAILPTHLCHNSSRVQLLQGLKHGLCCLGAGCAVVDVQARQAGVEGAAVGHLPAPQVCIFHIPGAAHHAPHQQHEVLCQHRNKDCKDFG